MHDRLPLIDDRLSIEFQRRLDVYMGVYDPSSIIAPRYRDWYADHAGRRSAWFRTGLVWRMERDAPLVGTRLLDFGCGTGSSTVVFGERGATVVGADTDEISLDVANQRIKDLNCVDRCALVRIPYISSGSAHLPFRDESFDVCALVGVIEHMKPGERIACVEEIQRVLRPGGRVFIFDTPNRAYPKDLHTTQLWFAAWLPGNLARRYAVWRKRFDPAHDFERYGGVGVSRWSIDALFPASSWHVSYEKSIDELAGEFVNPAATGVLHRATRLLVKGWFLSYALIGARPTFWTSSHCLGLTKTPQR